MKSILTKFLNNKNNKKLEYHYLFEIHDKKNQNIINLNSNLQILNYKKTDSGLDEMEICGIFNEQEISKNFSIEDVEIKISINNMESNLVHPFAHMIITSSHIEGEKFFWKLKPYTMKLQNHTVNKCYSKTCRVAFCSKECGLLLQDYKHIFLAYQAINNYIICDKVINKGFMGGEAIFLGKYKFQSKIIAVEHNKVFLNLQIPQDKFESVSLVASCDKSFESCHSVFNNAVNFRGEPHIPEYERLRIK